MKNFKFIEALRPHPIYIYLDLFTSNELRFSQFFFSHNILTLHMLFQHIPRDFLSKPQKFHPNFGPNNQLFIITVPQFIREHYTVRLCNQFRVSHVCRSCTCVVCKPINFLDTKHLSPAALHCEHIYNLIKKLRYETENRMTRRYVSESREHRPNHDSYTAMIIIAMMDRGCDREVCFRACKVHRSSVVT